MRTDIPIRVEGRIERDVHREMMDWWLRNAEDHKIVSFDQFVVELSVRGFNELPGRGSRRTET